ncbi:MAG TPA: hypothetical protein VL989_00960 [Candidatus Sulfotelmatobacter sp.]|nr:hypothetical protein [Candidatus Sulfotelmatobacter sp.]
MANSEGLSLHSKEKSPSGRLTLEVLKQQIRLDNSAANEALGHLVVNSQSRESSHAKKEELAEVSGAKIDTLNRADLLSVSEDIEVEGSNLRQVFESKLVGENGLRRLIKEYLRGGDLQKALSHEILERELDFERDPKLRDQALFDASNMDAGQELAPANLDSLIARAEKSLPVNADSPEFYEAKEKLEISQLKSQQSQLRYINAGLAIVTLILVILIVAILLSRP